MKNILWTDKKKGVLDDVSRCSEVKLVYFSEITCTVKQGGDTVMVLGYFTPK